MEVGYCGVRDGGGEGAVGGGAAGVGYGLLGLLAGEDEGGCGCGEEEGEGGEEGGVMHDWLVWGVGLDWIGM